MKRQRSITWEPPPLFCGIKRTPDLPSSSRYHHGRERETLASTTPEAVKRGIMRLSWLHLLHLLINVQETQPKESERRELMRDTGRPVETLQDQG